MQSFVLTKYLNDKNKNEKRGWVGKNPLWCDGKGPCPPPPPPNPRNFFSDQEKENEFSTAIQKDSNHIDTSMVFKLNVN